MQAAANKALVQRILDAYAQSDLTPFLDAIDPGIVWIATAPREHYAFGGHHAGRAETLAGFAKIAADYQVKRYDVVEMIGEGEIVWMSANVEFMNRKTGMHLRFPISSRWHIRAGRLLALTEYFDSASLLLQEGRLMPMRATE